MADFPLTRLLKRRSSRRWIATVAAFALLFGQWAVLTYACAPERNVPSASASAGHAHALPRCHGQPDAINPGACQQHCHPTPPTADHGKTPTVPPLAFTAPMPADAVSPARLASNRPSPEDARSTSPPLTTRYCRYLI